MKDRKVCYVSVTSYFFLFTASYSRLRGAGGCSIAWDSACDAVWPSFTNWTVFSTGVLRLVPSNSIVRRRSSMTQVNLAHYKQECRGD